MANVYEVVLAAGDLGKFRFSFSAEGGLERVSLRASARPGVRGKRPPSAPTLAKLRKWLQDYLSGKAGAFPGAWQMPGYTPFASRVYGIVAGLPSGTTLSYGEVARRAGSPRASRAVGNAMGRNPLPLVVP